MKEVVAAANAQQLSQPLNGEPFITRMIQLTEQMDNYCPSMMIDRIEGRPLELEGIYAIPLPRAANAGAATQQVDMLYRLLSNGETRSAQS